MHLTPSCSNCVYLRLFDARKEIYNCPIKGFTIPRENTYGNTCTCFEEKDDKTMIKHYCDICKKEIKADEETFTYTIESSGNDPTYDSCHEEVCKDCTKQIEDYIDYLAYVKYKDGEKK